MEFLQILGTTLLSLVILFLLTKLMGNKQISQLTMFDYITGITIGSIAAELATELEAPARPVEAMVLYGLIAILISFCSSKSNRMRGFLGGKPIILLQNGVLDRKKLKKSRLDINEFLTMARLAGFFDLSQVQTAVFEQNGNVSFLPKAQYRPANPNDMKLPVQPEELLWNVIVDGNVMERELQLAGKDAVWLKEQLKQQGFHDFREVFLATLDKNGALTCFSKPGKQ
ncbi:YetF domain-containing protein [uncultured Neglectibacter sp.]|uniref:YetF domain-containing protein n=1 Tax=uncultured Neglectibacter sp. TaxID=1924108 RepID=UPI0034DDFB7E